MRDLKKNLIKRHMNKICDSNHGRNSLTNRVFYLICGYGSMIQNSKVPIESNFLIAVNT
jgi:hypothetical protein